jgi:hypothetical protein
MYELAEVWFIDGAITLAEDAVDSSALVCATSLYVPFRSRVKKGDEPRKKLPRCHF